MKKIVLIGHKVSPSFIIFRRTLIKVLVAKGHKVYCFGTDFNDDTRSFLQNLGAIPISYKISRSGLNFIHDFQSLVEMRAKLRDIKPDIVLSFFLKPALLSSVACQWLGIKKHYAMLEGLGYIFTDIGYFSLKRKILRSLYVVACNLIFPKNAACIFLNNDDAKELKRLGADRIKNDIVLGPIGVDLNYYVPNKKEKRDEISFLFVGRLVADKGILEFLDAAIEIRSKYPNSRFIIAGEIDPQNPSSLKKEEISRFAEENMIDFIGHVDNIKEIYRASDVFVLPSYREGYPLSIQEAMSSGLPVIATDVPGCRESVTDYINGILVPPHQIEPLIRAMEVFLKKPNFLKSTSVAAREFALENFDENKQVEKLLSLILERQL